MYQFVHSAGRWSETAPASGLTAAQAALGLIAIAAASLLLEQRPRAQSRAHVLDPPRGAFLIFATRHRPVQGSRGYYRATMRHGVATVLSGQRTTLGVIFHDAA